MFSCNQYSDKKDTWIHQKRMFIDISKVAQLVKRTGPLPSRLDSDNVPQQ